MIGPGTRIGSYGVSSLLGRGGMGESSSLFTRRAVKPRPIRPVAPVLSPLVVTHVTLLSAAVT
jgi:hypothetical protein